MSRDNNARQNSVQSVVRATGLLSSLIEGEMARSLAELSSSTDIPKSTAHRLLATLIDCGFVSQDSDGQYTLGIRALELGLAASRHDDIKEQLRPLLDDLAASTGESVIVARPDWNACEVIVVDKRETVHAVSVVAPVGSRFSMFGGGSVGRCFLASLPEAELGSFLNANEDRVRSMERFKNDANLEILQAEIEEVRRRHLANDAGFYRDGVAGVSSWIDRLGQRSAVAIAVVGPASRLSTMRLKSIGCQLKQAIEGF